MTTVSAARAGLTETLKSFRASRSPQPVVFGSHRRPEAVIVPYAQYVKADGGQSVHLLPFLQQRATLVRRLAAASSISAVSVFGSVARQTDTLESDLDLLVTLEDSASTFDLAQFETDMEALAGRSIDLISSRTLDATRDRRILAEAIPL